METLIHADIFFFIASIGFVIIFILLAIALFYLIKLFRNVNAVALKVEGNIETISEEAKDMVLDIRDSRAFSLLFGKSRKRAIKQK